MKKVNLLLLLSLFFIAAGCKKSQGPDAGEVSMSLTVSFDDQLKEYNFSALNTEVTITNLITGQTNKATANEKGTVTFGNITQGTYNVTAALKMSAKDYNAQTNAYVTDDVVFNGSLGNQSVTAANTQLSLVLKSGRLGGWVIKQIYYAGSNQKNGAIFRDQFLEIYNNSNELMYADSLYFGQIEGVATAISKIDQSKGFYLQSGQFDWSKAIGNTVSKANENYLYAASLYMIPSDGSGKKYPVQPGGSIIIAQNAQNHKVSWSGNGTTYAVADPSLTVDLSHADFEAYLVDYLKVTKGTTKSFASDADNLNVTNLNIVVEYNNDFIMDNLGRDGFVVFKTTKDLKQYALIPAPDVKSITNDTKYKLRIPKAEVTIFDAVDIQPTSADARIPKKFTDDLDAGFGMVPGGSYSSQSIIRKTSKTVNGRRVLMDTNNSSNDFDYLDRADATKTIFK
ncbi:MULTISPECIES: DUF4876 domain-containing protein [unclassified Mucilaginibacter]|uniref:DUF4876 domain-containing protein n=1 Tax=unclassified Mucilaginibacter TaxID=2617802 RepID=UPI0031F663D7